MDIMKMFGNQKERRREKKARRGICPDCSGRGFFSSGFESLHVLDCNNCKGTGKV